MSYYVFTLDSHDTFGPFPCGETARSWGLRHRPTFTVLTSLPYMTEVLHPF